MMSSQKPQLLGGSRVAAYLLFAPLQLALLSFGSAQLALQVQRFGLRCFLFSQNLLHVAFHLQDD